MYSNTCSLRKKVRIKIKTIYSRENERKEILLIKKIIEKM